MPDWISRLLLTVIVMTGALNTVRLVSATAEAVEQISATEEALAELTQYITGVHAANRERLTTDAWLAPEEMITFDATFDRRLARLNRLTAEMTAATAHVGGWSGGFAPRGAAPGGLRDIDVERRAYVQAVMTSGTSETTPYHPRGVRLIDLQAQKLLATITVQRDHTTVAKAGALFVAETNVWLTLPAAALIISYLIWRPTRDLRLG